MHAPRREPFWPDEPDQPRAVDIAKRIALVRRYALVLPWLVAWLAGGIGWLLVEAAGLWSGQM